MPSVRETLEILITADGRKAVTEVDRVNGAYKKAFQSSDSVGSTMTSKLQSRFGALQNTVMSGLGAWSLYGAAVAGTGKVLYDLGQDASDLGEQVNKVDVVFKRNGESVVDWSKTLASSFGLSQTQALEAAGAFGTMLRTAGLNADQASKMSEKLVELAADMASFNNIDPSEALEKLRSGLAGEAEPLRTVGVLLTENAVKQFAYQHGIAQTGAQLTEGQKVQARYGLILKQTSLQQGDFARTSGSLANQQRVLNAELANLRTTLGTAVLPYLRTATHDATLFAHALSSIPDIADSLSGFQQLLGVGLPDLDVGQAILGGIPGIGQAFQFRGVLEDAIGLFDDAGDSAGSASEQTDRLRQATSRYQDLVAAGKANTAEGRQAKRDLSEANRDVEATQAKVTAATRQGNTAMHDMATQTGDATASVKNLDSAMQGLTSSVLAYGDATRGPTLGVLDVEDAKQRFADAQDAITKARLEGPREGESQEQFTRRIAGLERDRQRALLGIAAAQDALNQKSVQAADANKTLSDTEESVYDATVQRLEAQRDAATDPVVRLGLQLTINQLKQIEGTHVATVEFRAAKNPSFAAYLAQLSAAGESTVYVPVGGGRTAPVPISAFRATGGPVTAGNAYIVGERGMELFIPKMDGMIAPDLGAFHAPRPTSVGGSSGTVNNKTVNAPVTVTTAQRFSPAEIGREIAWRS